MCALGCQEHNRHDGSCQGQPRGWGFLRGEDLAVDLGVRTASESSALTVTPDPIAEGCGSRLCG